MKTKHHLAVFFFLVCCFCGHTQSDYIPSKVSFSLRGKYFVFGLENTFLRGYNYGAEIHFGKHHSIGADGGMFRTSWDTDDGDDSDGSSDILYSSITRRTFVYVDYKYLFPFKNQVLYAQCYTKQNGRYFSFNKKRDTEYGLAHPETFEGYGRGNFSEYGAGIGAMLYFKKTEGRLGVDVNLNLAFRNGSTLTRYHSDTNGWKSVSDSDDMVYPYFRFTLFYHFFRYQK
jgi:hypothetical protein